MSRSLRTLVAAALLTMTSAGVASAQSLNLFGGTAFSCQNASITPGSCFSAIQNNGDRWSQAAMTGPAVVGKLTLDLWYENGITQGPLNFNVFLNGLGVGSFSLGGPPVALELASYDFFFAPIAANQFDLDIVLASGAGANDQVGLFTSDYAPYERFSAATLDVTPVPEPATLALLAPGLAMVGVVARRRRRSRAN